MHVLPNAPAGRPIPGRYELRFVDSRRETPTVTTFRFSTNGTGFRYRSNQAIRLVLPGVDDPRGPARTFSLSSSPTETGTIAVTAKMTGSPYKEALHALQPGAPALAFGPLGDLFYDPTRSSLFIAGGIGITPFRGMLRYAVDTGGTEPIVLLYSARVPEEFAFRDEIDRLARGRPALQVRYTVTRPSESRQSWPGRVGRIDEGWIEDALAALRRPKVYAVGLPQMVIEMLNLLKSRFGVSEDDLEYEFFRGY